jgi:Protein of unknown function (DUF3262)/Transglycosylase SLT domain
MEKLISSLLHRAATSSWAVFLLIASTFVQQAVAQTCSGSGDYTNYLRAIAQRESAQNPNAVNQFGYLGLYQMGCPALRDTGYMNANCQWTGRDGITTNQQFLANPNVQTAAINLYNQLQWGYIRNLGLDRFVGQTVGGIPVTQSGLIAGAHLVGVGNLQNWLNSGGASVPRDGNGVPITQYVSQFCGYNISFDVVTWSQGGFSTPGGGVGVPGPTGTGTTGSSIGWLPPLRSLEDSFSAGAGVRMADFRTLFISFIALLLFTWAAWMVMAGHRAWLAKSIGTVTYARDIAGVFVVLSLMVWVLS